MSIYPNEAHVQNQPMHRYEIYERNADWFKFWFRGLEDPDPAKTEQYARWRKLRKLQEQNQRRTHKLNVKRSNAFGKSSVPDSMTALVETAPAPM